MATPVVKQRGTIATLSGPLKLNRSFATLATSDPCGQCAPHLMSDHVVEKSNQCNKCTCVAQDTENA
jgi:hypothetical protein